MKLRKTNAVFSLICTVLLLGHAISLAIWMLSMGNVPAAPSALPRALTVFFVVHAIISIILLIASHKDGSKNKGNPYLKLNAPTVVQRVSGILLIVFTWLHIAGTIGIMTPPPLIHAIVPPLFFALTLAHVAVSTTKAFVTLGIGNVTFIKRADLAIKGICAVTLVADVIGFYLYVC